MQNERLQYIVYCTTPGNWCCDAYYPSVDEGLTRVCCGRAYQTPQSALTWTIDQTSNFTTLEEWEATI